MSLTSAPGYAHREFRKPPGSDLLERPAGALQRCAFAGMLLPSPDADVDPDAVGKLLYLIGAVGPGVIFRGHQPLRRPMFDVGRKF
jgi:hypothetical protein